MRDLSLSSHDAELSCFNMFESLKEILKLIVETHE